MMVKLAIAPMNSTQPPLMHSPSLPSFNSSFGAASSKLYKGRSCELPKLGSNTAICRASSATFGTFSDDEFSKKNEEMAMQFRLPNDPKMHHEPPDWPMVVGEEMMIERKANNMGLPLSLRMIERKQQCFKQENNINESTYCSAKKAFASMVFIIRELHSYTLQMREVLSYEDSSRVLARVNQEIHASFVWLFEHVFSQTPTLVVYVMLLLANFTIDSMANNVSIVASLDNVSIVATREEELLSCMEEETLWKLIVDEASVMQVGMRGESLDSETVQRLVAPVKVEMDSDKGYAEYFMTELRYLMGLAKDSNNPLLLANFAQFLYLVVRDYGRAEEYFKKATAIEPKDGEACYKYANFLWNTKNDLGATEDAYVEAMSAEPSNAYYASTYANFLWNTGGKETCFPLNTPEDGEPCDA